MWVLVEVGIMNIDLYHKIEAYMHTCMCDSAHDEEHVYRVLYNALQIAQEEQAVDYDVLIAACLLHDIARADQFQNPMICHARFGGEKARKFLLEQGLPTEFGEKVCHCIQTHRFRKANPPQTIEAKILFDADKLDVTGAIGISRTLMYQAEVDGPLYTKRFDGSISDGREDEDSSFFREYKVKLENLYDKFYTRKGAKLAYGRQKIAKDFYESLYREISEGYADGRKLLDALVD